MKTLFIATCLLLLTTCLASADENSDLDLIPKSISEKMSEAAPRASSPWKSKLLVEEAATSWQARQGIAIPPPTSLPNWQSATSIDAQTDFRASSGLQFHLSDRLNLIAEDDITFPHQDNLRNDLRELSGQFEIGQGNFFLQAGRINTRNGVALGFNPSDFLKPRTAVLQSSIDPSAARENRLGVFQVIGQAIFEKLSLQLIAAPKLESNAPLAKSETSLSLRLGETNGEDRWLATAAFELWDLSPQLLYFHDFHGDHFGANFSHGIGSSVVVYAEWAGGKVASLENRALKFAYETGTLPLAPRSGLEEFQNDIAIGGSWTSSSKYTLNLEFHFHQGGLPAGDLRTWIDKGSASPLLGKQLWLIRQYASEQQEPLGQRQIFARLAVPDFIWNRNEFDIVTFINPDDGSATTQLADIYFLTDAWTLSFYWTNLFGAAMSERGSLPFENISAVKIGRYF